MQLAGPCKDGMEVEGSKVKGGMFGTSEVGSRGDGRGLGGDEGVELCRAVFLHCAVSRHFVLLRVSRNDQFVSHKKQNRFGHRFRVSVCNNIQLETLQPTSIAFLSKKPCHSLSLK